MRKNQKNNQRTKISAEDSVKLYELSNGNFQQATLLWFNTERNFGLVRMFDDVCVLVHISVIRPSRFRRKLLKEKDLPVLVVIGLIAEPDVFKVKEIMSV